KETLRFPAPCPGARSSAQPPSPCSKGFGSALFDLTEFQIDRHGAPEDRNFHLEPRTLLVHLLDKAVERGERTVGNADRLADLEGNRRLWPLDALLHLMQDAVGFLVRDVHRLGRMLVLAEKTRHARDILDHADDCVVQI